MILFPPAKINLGLNVIEKRMDGFHELETIMVPIPLFDILEIIPSTQLNFKQSGAVIDGDMESNLCVRAFRILQEKYDIEPVSIHLRKQIPIGAGLGGGSADASFTLLALNELFNLKLNYDVLEKFAAQLGSDCPLFIKNIPQLATGRGELLSPVSVVLPSLYLVIIKPDIHINTATAYEGVHISGDRDQLLSAIEQPVEEWKNVVKNDFEQHIFKLHPILSEIKSSLYEQGAVYASMSGSGSSMFGLFQEKPNLAAINNAQIYYLGYLQ